MNGCKKLADDYITIVSPVAKVFHVAFVNKSHVAKDSRYALVNVELATKYLTLPHILVDFPEGRIRYAEICSLLIERELAEWRDCGPDGQEIFATGKLLSQWKEEQ